MLTKKHLVYVIGLEGLNGYCKIGVSHNTAERLKQISTGSPFKPYLAHWYRVGDSYFARLAERESHKALRKFRVNGEWFKMDPIEAWEIVKPIALQHAGVLKRDH